MFYKIILPRRFIVVKHFHVTFLFDELMQNTPTRTRARLCTRRVTRRQPTRNVRRFPLLQGQIVVMTQNRREKRREFIMLPIALVCVVALVCFGNDQIVCLINQRGRARFALLCFTLTRFKRINI